MKVKIIKQFDKLGEEYLDSVEVEAVVSRCGDCLTVEVDGILYEIPDDVLFGVLNTGTST